MENTIFVGLSKQVALAKNMDVIANNIANMSTPGYRGQNMVFTEHLEDLKGNPDTLSMVLDYGHYQNTMAGTIQNTGNPLDVAVQGPGWFGIQTADEVMYTRAGNFQVNVNGELVDGRGRLVADAGGGAIVIPQEAIDLKIAEDGSVSSSEGVLGQIMVMEFENQQTLEAQGNGLYRATVDGVPAVESRVMQGMLEGSNVNPITEMTRMIEVSRAYQSTQRMLQSEHDRQRGMIQKLTQGG